MNSSQTTWNILYDSIRTHGTPSQKSVYFVKIEISLEGALMCQQRFPGPFGVANLRQMFMGRTSCVIPQTRGLWILGLGSVFGSNV